MNEMKWVLLEMLYLQTVWNIEDWNIEINFKIDNYIFNTIIVSNHMHQENPEGTQVIVGSIWT